MLRIRIPRVAAASVAALVLLTAAASGQGGPTSRLAAVLEPGNVSLYYVGKPGSTVYFDERVGDSVQRIGSLPIGPGGYVVLKDATVWHCERLERRFEATEVQSDGSRLGGSFDVRTGSCAQRFKLRAPARAGLGAVARVRVVDRWKIGGIRTRLCITPPRGRSSCGSLAFPRAVNVSSRRFRATKRGLWKIELRVRGHRVRTAVRVGSGGAPVAPAPLVLATGDSTMQGIDNFLADHLGEKARVRSDVRPGTGISRGAGWITRAAQQALRLKPRTTVISIGGGEGYAMQTPSGTSVACCDGPWVLEYARRVRLMMKSYRQRGAGKLLWLAAPAQRSALSAVIIPKVNEAVLSAAEGMPGVKVLRLDTLFTPNGYRNVMRYRGQDVRVGAVDGVHLTTAGTAIAAEAIEAAIRKGW